jgi:hypothetical protein
MKHLSTCHEEELRHIRVFFQLGCRMMHLTHNRRNPIGDGCAEPANAGLSDFGRAVVQEMNRVGTIVDVAHSGWQTCLDAARASKRPVVVSHSCAWALNHHHRCKPDEVIRAVVDTGGTMGITNVPAFLGTKGDIGTMLDHIDYVAGKFGVDHVTIGTDRAYVSSAAERENLKIPRRARRYCPITVRVIRLHPGEQTDARHSQKTPQRTPFSSRKRFIRPYLPPSERSHTPEPRLLLLACPGDTLFPMQRLPPVATAVPETEETPSSAIHGPLGLLPWRAFSASTS